MKSRRVFRTHAKVKPLYTGLRVRNLGRSIRFYRLLGFRQTMRMKTGIGEFAQLEHRESAFTIELNYFPKGSRVYEPIKGGTQLDHFGFEVDDVDSWFEKLCRAGGSVRRRPFDTELIVHGETKGWVKGRAAYVADPDGIWIELLGPPSSGERKPRG